MASALNPHHHHPSNPEEQDVVPGLQDGGGVEASQVRQGGLRGVRQWRGLGLGLGPAQGAEGPQAGGEPGVQHILVLE